jgi:hypothetical protein
LPIAHVAVEEDERRSVARAFVGDAEPVTSIISIASPATSSDGIVREPGVRPDDRPPPLDAVR